MQRLLGCIAFAALAAVAGCDSVSCRTISTDVGALCLPDTVAANSDFILQVREACGRNCSHNPTCSASLSGGAIVLDVHQDVCNDVSVVTCEAIPCSQRVANCRVPSLPAGDYPLVVPGGAGGVVRVRPGGQSSCQIPASDGGV